MSQVREGMSGSCQVVKNRKSSDECVPDWNASSLSRMKSGSLYPNAWPFGNLSLCFTASRRPVEMG
jgi:hypothetical protein